MTDATHHGSLEGEETTDVPDYPTDRFGDPDGRNYHYRIPATDDVAVRRAHLALYETYPYGERRVAKWRDHSGNPPAYRGIKTVDSKGQLDGLAQYVHSPKWVGVSDRVAADIDEYRSNPSGRGTKIRGTVDVDVEGNGTYAPVRYDVVVRPTPTEVAAALEDGDDTWGTIREAVSHAKTAAADDYTQRLAEAQRACPHEDTASLEGRGGVSRSADGVAFCHDCGAEIDTEGRVVG